MTTPMLKQYYTLKEQYPGTILLMQVGDFYEAYGEDAETFSRDAEIVLTSRDAGKHGRLPMAGVPHHALDQYLRPLVAKGHRVAVCEQMEDPKKAQGLVKRDVTRVISSGTILDPQMLDTRSHNYLAALTGEGTRTGLAVADVSTGEFQVTSFEAAGPQRVLEELLRWHPAELLVDPAWTGHPALAPELEGEGIIATLIAPPAGADPIALLAGHFGLAAPSGLGLDDRPLAARAAAIILRYLRDTQKTRQLNLEQPRVYHSDDYLVLDSSTRRNLELFSTLRSGERKGSLLWVLDDTRTAMGARLLRGWLERPLCRKAEIEARLDAVEEALENFTLTTRLREELDQVPDLERILSKVVYGTAGPRDLVALRRALEALPRVRSSARQYHSPLWSLLAQETGLHEELRNLLGRALQDDPPLALTEGGIIRPLYNSQVDELRQIRSCAKEWIAALEEHERQRTGIKSLKVGFTRVFGYYLEVTRANLHLVPPDFIRKQTIAGGERFISPELKEHEAKVLGAQEKLQGLEYELFLELREETARQADSIRRSAGALAALDVLSNLAALALRHRYVRPQIQEDRVLKIVDGRHPVVERVSKEAFVPNDTLLDGQDNRLLIVTGPNMAGKSTYLRQIALITILAQLGSFVPAASAQVGLADRVFTRVGATDDLHLGQSTFLVEMSETANILHSASGRSLIILDEIGRGTSTYDGMSLAWAVAEYIHDTLGSRALFATHFHQLTRLAQTHPGVKNYRVAVRENLDQIVFLHKILPGGTDRSYGVYVAQLAGIPQTVLERAGEVLKELESQEGGGSVIGGEAEPARAVQLSFFEPLPYPSWVDELRHLDLSRLTPLEALQLLAAWQQSETESAGKGSGDVGRI